MRYYVERGRGEGDMHPVLAVLMTILVLLCIRGSVCIANGGAIPGHARSNDLTLTVRALVTGGP